MEYKVEPEASLPTNQAICHFADYIWWGRDEHVVLWKETRWAQTTTSLTSCVQDICCHFQQSCSFAKRRADQASILVICWSGPILFESVRPMCHQITVARYFTFSDNLLKISHDAQYYSLATTRSVWDVIAIAPFTCTAHSTPAQRSHQRSTATSASKWLINIIFHSLSQLFARS